MTAVILANQEQEEGNRKVALNTTTNTHVHMHTHTHTRTYTHTHPHTHTHTHTHTHVYGTYIPIYTYGVATISRLLKIISLFCKISSLL